MTGEPTTVGIVSPGDMGQAIGGVLVGNGLRVVAALDGRSRRTRELARQAGIEDVGTVERLVESAQIVLSVVVPAAAVVVAERVAAALIATGAAPLYADCNAVAPATASRAGEIVGAAGARFVDAGIIGSPPRGNAATRIYASGEAAGELAVLCRYGLDVRVLGPAIGAASGLKMCYGALTKGVSALATQLLVAAERLDLDDALRQELRASQPALLGWIDGALPSMPPKAHRWVGEMEQIAATFEAVGLTPRLFDGVAELYRWVATTPPGRETPETRVPRDADATVAALAMALPER
ncbi:MAG TPA: DUF1932 domain-containing protein [Thermomicrobiaceae bacterium]|nr:DUF1932 domain-containing protein [Thermomicrobiaceae bacterium]